MANRQAPPRNYFIVFGLLVVLIYSLIYFTGKIRTPQLGLDLKGGTTVTLTARTPSGQPPSRQNLELARQIIEQRVNGLGVAGAEVVTEGNSNIVISVPGANGEKARQLGATAQLRFRPVLKGPEAAGSAASASTSASASGSASASAAPSSGAAAAPSGSASPSASAAPSASASATPSPSASATASGSAAPSGSPAAASDQVSGTQEQATAGYATLKCNKENIGGETARPSDYLATCSQDGTVKYLLGPAIIEGTDVTNARAGTEQTTGAWIVLVDFDSKARTVWADYTAANVGKNVAFTLDGRVISAPTIQSAINGTTQITGNFTQQKATELANQLKYGALPLTFSQATAQTISTELGSQQLRGGLIAGAIGLALVFVYALLYYRGLGLVMIASLILSATIVYGSLVLLTRQIGFTLSLAGIAGFIVAIGITADSFVVYFERIKDEIREGRTWRSAVPRAWVRARRTILSADAVSFLAAGILWVLAIGDVKGFAFTLGLSTVLDLVIVFLFTHPLLIVLSRWRSFGSSRISGLGRVDRRRAAGGRAAPAGRELVGAAAGAQDRSTS